MGRRTFAIRDSHDLKGSYSGIPTARVTQERPTEDTILFYSPNSDSDDIEPYPENKIAFLCRYFLWRYAGVDFRKHYSSRAKAAQQAGGRKAGLAAAAKRKRERAILRLLLDR